jgi:glycosyltransferase involved in cell wall biosynthesis
MTLMTLIRLVTRRLPVPPWVLQSARRRAALGFRTIARVRTAGLRRPASPPQGPIVVAGFHSSVVGIGEGARMFSAALRQAGLEVIDWDISADFGHPKLLAGDYVVTPPEGPGVLVMHLNPVALVQLVAMKGAAPFQDRYCVGYWAWELPEAPKVWRHAFRYVHEAWTPSRFVADAVRPVAPAGAPLRILPHPLEPPAAAQPDRARFGLPPEGVVVLTAFDMRSSLARKNPHAAVEAFRLASQTAPGATMVCKVAGWHSAPAVAAALEARLSEIPNTVLITEWLSEADMAALLAASDIVLSLHRSEGFGLLLAQAMLAGKATIATGWSGNLDFMTAENSVLVPAGFIEVEDAQGIYRSGRWADPDVAAAAQSLASLIADEDRRRRLGERAAEDLKDLLSPERLGALARSWLQPSGG